MARALRIEYAGACYHVINRGNYRRNLFGEAGAAMAFERTLEQAARRFGWRIHAYVVMRNHFHLAIEIAEPNLSLGMKWLQGTWVRRYNGFRRLVGRPFQGRFKALIVEPGHALGQVCHYIHLNPVRAGAITADGITDYPWSSLPRFVRGAAADWLDGTTVLEEAGGLADTAAGWRKYLEYLQFLAADRVAKRELAAKRMSQGWCLGTRRFRQDVRREAVEKGMRLDLERFAGLEPEVWSEEREHGWERRLSELAKAGWVVLERLPAKASADQKVLLAAALKRTTSVSNGWLAHRLQMGKPASVSQFVRRWELNDAKRRSIDTLLSKVKT